MLPAIPLLLALGQSLPPALDPQVARTPDGVDRTMGLHVVQPDRVGNRCSGKFMRLKVKTVVIDIALDLDAGGGVTDARLASASPDPKLERCVLEQVRNLRFKDEAPRHGIYVFAMSNANLMPKPPKYVQYDAADAAVIYRWKSALGLCSAAGTPAPDAPRRNICTAFVAMIDGGVARWIADHNSLSPGTHTLFVTCVMEQYGTPGFPMPNWTSATHAYALEARTNYQVRPRWKDGNCVVDLVDVMKDRVLEDVPMAPPASPSS